MKILILTFYFKPDLCAGSFRMQAFVESLKEKLSEYDRVDILTTMPNRYSSFKKECLNEELMADNIFIKRIELPNHKSGFIDQARAFFTYFKTGLMWAVKRRYDFVFATSSRLFTGFMGALVSKLGKIPLYLDIRDIFTDTMDSLLPKKISYIFMPFFKVVEEFTLKQAKKINMVSPGFKQYLVKVAPDSQFSYYTNGIDDIFLKNWVKQPLNSKKEKSVITYAGNIGKGQALDKVIPKMACLLGEKYIIQVVGDGGIRHVLEEELNRLNVGNVFIKDPVDRDELIRIYNDSDWLFFHLDDCPAFEKVLPSKIFEYAAVGKPIIAGAAGYAAEFVKKNINGSIVFKPCDADDFFGKFSIYYDSQYDRHEFRQRFKRKTIMDKMSEDVLEACVLNNVE